ncbi:hypothetical protein Ga0061064_2298 [Pseudidiomarina woesei]|uniref:Uncharacterized protein n=1 Tax=Pseudidiomarina woesei TaxID=1381080 RepID=A0A0K6HCI4_9GAMM|nr:hypothetical protein Ga0061064_2298 [Pseudidiomarina woesei]
MFSRRSALIRDLLVKVIERLVDLLLGFKSLLLQKKNSTQGGVEPILVLTYEEKKVDQKRAKKFSKAHRAYVGKPYILQCSEVIFSEDERKSLMRYGSWLSALASNKIKPETPAQEEFLQMCQEIRGLSFSGMLAYYQNKSDELDVLRAVWLKYLCRVKFERDNPNLPKENIKVDWGWHGPPIHSGDHVFFSK